MQPSQVTYRDLCITWSTATPRKSPKKRSNDLERSQFRQQVQSFVCVPPSRRVTWKFWEMLKNASEVTLAPKNIFSLKLCAMFCEVQSKPGWLYFHVRFLYQWQNHGCWPYNTHVFASFLFCSTSILWVCKNAWPWISHHGLLNVMPLRNERAVPRVSPRTGSLRICDSMVFET